MARLLASGHLPAVVPFVLFSIILNNNEDSEDFRNFSPEQIAWLKADVKAAKKDKEIHWIIAVMYKGPYTTSNHATDDDKRPLVKKWALFTYKEITIIFPTLVCRLTKDFPCVLPQGKLYYNSRLPALES